MGRTYGCQTALLVRFPICSLTVKLWSWITYDVLQLVPFEEDDKDPSVWFLDHNYVESMNDMFKKINAREKLIGWYHSGPKLRASDLEINELFKRYTPNPLLVIIDVQPKEAGVPTDAYFAVEEIKDVRMCYREICGKMDTYIYLGRNYYIQDLRTHTINYRGRRSRGDWC